MFCYQCEQAAQGKGCTQVGVCGKQPDAAALQDLIVYQLKGIGFLAHHARRLGATDDDVNRFTVEALFTTVTNVNFDPERLERVIREGEGIRNRAHGLYVSAARAKQETVDERALPAPARFQTASTLDELVAQGAEYGIAAGGPDGDVRALQQLLVYGIKGMAAYIDHALILGKTDDAVFAFVHEALASLCNPSQGMDELVELCMRCGKVNIRAMEILDEGHTSRYGHPQPAQVSTGTVRGPAIVVSGHDLLDLEALLEQTAGTGARARPSAP